MFKVKSIVSISVLVALLITSVTTVNAANETEIEQAVSDGVAWLAKNQNIEGSWGTYAREAHTCFALIKLQDRAYELGYDSPFDPNYEYSGNVTEGWKYILPARLLKQTLSPQDHTAGASGTVDDPDANGNGYGLYSSGTRTYSTGICAMAIASSGTPNRPNDGGADYDSDGNNDTYLEIAQDVADWLAYAQGDLGNDEGGWGYIEHNNSGGSTGYTWTDNSVGGYATLGIAAVEAFGATVPAWVKTELDVWITTIQDTSGGTDDGGSYYNPDYPSYVNELKTGNLIFQMTLYGDSPSAQRFIDAMDYIERHWNDSNLHPGWGQGLNPAEYQAMYTLMKGFEFSGIDLIDLDNDSVAEHDWFNESSTVLVNQQNPDGSWPSNCWRGNSVLCTVWALLTLEKISPPPPTTEVGLDVKPSSCPNPINTGSNGVLPVAIAGTDTFDVMDINLSTVLLGVLNESTGTIMNPISPIRYTYEDVTEPYIPGENDACCIENQPDSYTDLSLKFDTQELVASGLDDYVGQEICLGIAGSTNDGQDFTGKDCVRIQAPKKAGKKK